MACSTSGTQRLLASRCEGAEPRAGVAKLASGHARSALEVLLPALFCSLKLPTDELPSLPATLPLSAATSASGLSPPPLRRAWQRIHITRSMYQKGAQMSTA